MPTADPPADPRLAPVTPADFALLRDLATRIWRQAYTGMIPAAQIDYMLGNRFADEALERVIHDPDRWLEILRVAGTPVGYCGGEVVAAEPDTLKLGQLYLLDAFRGRGLGRFMLERVEERARLLGKGTIFLQVHKRNTAAQAFYRAAGFTLRGPAVFDIGGGFFMDDYLLEKRLDRFGPDAAAVGVVGPPRHDRAE